MLTEESNSRLLSEPRALAARVPPGINPLSPSPRPVPQPPASVRRTATFKQCDKKHTSSCEISESNPFLGHRERTRARAQQGQKPQESEVGRTKREAPSPH
ncbi:hypothetical protein PG984_006524 [Apiospora sp. TS-2023a]